MIPKGSQRGGGQQLAAHLLNEFDNDRVEVAEVRGAIAPDLHGAFAEWSATAQGTRCRKYLYSLSVNPDPEQGELTRAQYVEFVERAEAQLGLSGQPRAVVFHVKQGREHCHVVWSRIDTEKMRAVQLSHDRYDLRTVVMEFARDHGLDLPGGITRDRSREGRSRRRAENLAEKQQEERTGETRDERMRAITQAWRESDDARSLIHALEARGYLLARGDRRAYVVVDRFGEIHSLARQIEGVKTKQVKERLGSYPLDDLPDAKKAQAFARAQREGVSQDREKAEIEARQRREALAQAHAVRRARLDEKRQALKQQHRIEREHLRVMQAAANRGIALKREASRPKGVFAFLTRITGIEFVRGRRAQRADVQRLEEQRRQTEALRRRHSREMQDFARHGRALSRIEAREKRSLERALRREEFARIAGRPGPPSRPPEGLTRTFGNAAGAGAPPPRPAPPPQPLTPEFNEAAEPSKAAKPPAPLTPEFGKAAAPPEPPERERSNGGLSPQFNDEASGTTKPDSLREQQKPAAREREPPKEGSLSEAFEQALKERAEREKQRRDRERDQKKGPRGPGPGRGV